MPPTGFTPVPGSDAHCAPGGGEARPSSACSGSESRRAGCRDLASPLASLEVRQAGAGQSSGAEAGPGIACSGSELSCEHRSFRDPPARHGSQGSVQAGAAQREGDAGNQPLAGSLAGVSLAREDPGAALGVVGPLDRLVLTQLVAVMQLASQAVRDSGGRPHRHGRSGHVRSPFLHID